MPDFMNLHNIFAAISIFATVFFVIKLILFTFLGGDVEVNADFDTITETDVSFNFISVQSVLTFFMGFGWSGLACMVRFNSGAEIAIPVAIVVGFAFMLLTAYLMFLMKKLNKNIKVDINELKGREGKAYNSIEPHSEGQIEIILNNKLSFLNAINNSECKIEAFTPVMVEKVENNKIYVKRTDKE